MRTHLRFSAPSFFRACFSFLLLVCVCSSLAANAQTFQVIYSFPGGPPGSNPDAGLTMDRAGNLYGTAGFGGSPSCDYECGTVFKLSPHGGGWVLNVLYSFLPNGAGSYPEARAIIGPNGSLYSTTYYGGAFTIGTVFNLQPLAHAPATALTSWTETILHSFAGGDDGDNPLNADLIFDSAGNIYGTTPTGGDANNGTVYELSPSNRGWTEKVLYSFPGGPAGASPNAGVILDQAGNLYGVAVNGGTLNCGTVFELSPSGSGWTETTLHTFTREDGGCYPVGGLTFDTHGDLIGTTCESNAIVFMLSPTADGWTFSRLYTLGQGPCPGAQLTFDSAGNLYGTTEAGGAYNYGNVFRLSPSNGSWSYTDLYDFTNGSDGSNPHSNVLIDANGNLFGTTNAGGLAGYCPGGTCGTIWEITP